MNLLECQRAQWALLAKYRFCQSVECNRASAEEMRALKAASCNTRNLSGVPLATLSTGKVVALLAGVFGVTWLLDLSRRR